MWALKLGRWASHSVPPVLRRGLPLCLMPTVQEALPTPGMNMDTCTLHRRAWHLRPGWTTEQAHVRSRLALWTGLGPGPCVGFAQ